MVQGNRATPHDLPSPLSMTRTITTPKDGIDAVRKVGGALGWGGKPYLRELAYDPDDPLKTWWLVSTGEKPAYHRAKIAFTRVNGSLCVWDSGMFVGLNVEKGLAGKAIEYVRGPGRSEKHKRWAMDGHWAWHSFMRALTSGEFENDLKRAHAAADGSPITVALSVAEVLIDAPSVRSDYDVPRGDRHEVQYVYSGDQLALVHDHKTPEHARLLNDAKGARSLHDLASRIEGAKDLNWKWVDVYIGFHFTPAVNDAAGAWGSSEVWERICRPWADWLWDR